MIRDAYPEIFPDNHIAFEFVQAHIPCSDVGAGLACTAARRPNRRQFARTMQFRQRQGIAAVGFGHVAGLDRNEGVLRELRDLVICGPNVLTGPRR